MADAIVRVVENRAVVTGGGPELLSVLLTRLDLFRDQLLAAIAAGDTGLSGQLQADVDALEIALGGKQAASTNLTAWSGVSSSVDGRQLVTLPYADMKAALEIPRRAIYSEARDRTNNEVFMTPLRWETAWEGHVDRQYMRDLLAAPISTDEALLDYIGATAALDMRILDRPVADILFGLEDGDSNIGGFVVREGGGIETDAIKVEPNGDLITARIQMLDDGFGNFHFVDMRGNSALSIFSDGRVVSPSLMASDAGDDPDDLADITPLLDSHFFMVEGPALPLYVGNLLKVRADPPPVVLSVSSGRLNVEGSGLLMLDPALCAPTGELTTRSTQTADGILKVLPLTTHVAPAGTGQTVTVLAIGDSITKGSVPDGSAMADNIVEELNACGYVGVAVGTITPTGGGALNEGRSSRHMDDYVGANISNMAPVTDDAAYIAGLAAYKAERNPFLVPASGADDVFGTGWKLDFGAYRSRFSIPAPDLIAIGLVTNSLGSVDLPTGIASILRGMNIWRNSIRADLPTAMIGFYATTIPRDPESDARHKDRRAPAMAAMIKRVRSYGDANCRFINVHAHMNQQNGWDLGDTVTDPDSGVITSTPNLTLDNIHPNGPPAKQAGRALAYAAACARTGA